ncbi:MAG TPA: tetratricopeptide repeat protein [Planctomycetaceae bacterium]|nr:tetratricopeptide repeat protein [Planctomycetaceae bacterium]
MADTWRDAALDLNAAAAYYETVLAANPEQWDVLYLYGTALLQLGRFHEAIDVCSRAAKLHPEVPDVYNNLAVAYQRIGDFDAAARAYRTAIELNPDFDLAHSNLARLHESAGRFADAETSLQRAIQLKPAEPAYWLQLAGVLSRQGKQPEAESVLQEGIGHQPQNLDLKMNLAAALVQQERLDEAGDVYRAVIDARPDFAEAHSSLAFVLERQGRLSEALVAAERAVELRLDYSEGFNNLGIVLRSLHRLDEACVAFRRAIELNPEFVLAEFNLGTTLLLAGRYPEGWPGYRQHARVAGTAAPGSPSTEWDARPIAGQRLLVYADQGLGDTIQFARFLPLCKQRSEARLIFRCQPSLQRLLAECSAADAICTTEDDLLAFDRHVPLASLPGIFGMTVEQVGLSMPYLKTVTPLPPRIGELLGKKTGDRRIGLVWQGNPRQTRDVVRSCPLEKTLPLLELPGMRFFSLQCDSTGRSQLAASPAADCMVDVGGLLEDFADTAAVLQRLDLLITVDTAIAHLAGALGRPVWTMLCHTPDWRWHLDRSDSPWYPTMRLFRQPTWGDWDSVIKRIRAELQAG